MADWNEPEGKPKHKKARQPHKQAIIRANGNDWQGKGSVPQAGGVAGQDWNTEASDGGPSLNMAWIRWGFGVVSLLALLIGLFAVYYYGVFRRPVRLPVYAIIRGSYTSATIGENPLHRSERENWLGPITAGRQIDSGLEARFTESDSNTPLTNDLLTRIRVDREGLIQFFRKNNLNFDGGGPNRRGSLWLLSGVAGVNSESAASSDRLVLYENDADDTRSVESNSLEYADPSARLARNGLLISELLRQIADAVDDDHRALVVLDLRAPPVVVDLGKQTLPWQQMVSAALQAAGDNAQRRLIIVSAAGDGEANWYAPELGGGVLTHFVGRGLRGESDLDRNRVVSVAEFRDYLDRSVTNWVARRRDAAQRPQWWIPGAMQGSLQSVPLFDLDERSKFEGTPPVSLAVAKERVQTMLALWRRHAAICERAVHESPLELGIAEANLTLLHEFLERDITAGWSELVEQTENALRLCERTGPTVKFSSVHEWASDLSNSETVRLLATWLQAFDANANLAADAKPVSFPDLQRSQLAWLIWTEAIGRKRDTPGEDYARENGLDRQRLKDLLAAYDERFLAEDAAEGALHELHVLRLLDSDIDWNTASAQGEQIRLSRVVVDLCQCYDVLQEIAGRYALDGRPWIESDLASLERRWLTLFDQTLVGQWQIDRELDALRADLLTFRSRSQQLNGYLQLQRRVLHEQVPMLTWITSGHHIASSRANVEDSGREVYLQRIKNWQQLRANLDQFTLTMSREANAASLDDLLRQGQLLSASFETLRDDWRRYASALAAGTQEERTERNYRDFQIALRSPLTNVDERERIYGKWIDFVSSYDPQLYKDVLASEFKFAETRQDIGVADPFAALWESAPASAGAEPAPLFLGQRPDLSEMTVQWNGYDALQEAALRQAALVIAHRYPQGEGSVSEGWARRLRISRAVALAEYWRWAGDKATNEGFGNGLNNDDSRPHFYRIANLYLNNINRLITGISSAPSARTYVDTLHAGLQSKMDSGLRWVDATSARFGSDGKLQFERRDSEIQVPVAIDIAAEQPLIGPVKAAVRLSNGDSLTALATLEGNTTTAVTLTAPQTTSELAYSLNQLRDQGYDELYGELSFRGHHQKTPLAASEVGTDVPEVFVEWKPARISDTRLRVLAEPEPPLLNVMLLLDCSGSMGTQDVDMGIHAEAAGRKRGTLITKVALEARDLLTKLRLLHEARVARVKVGIAFLGVIIQPSNTEDPLIEMLQPGGLAERVGMRSPVDEIMISRTELIDSGNWFDTLNALIRNGLSARGHTPLYLSIDRTLEAMQAMNPGAIQQLIVIGDGADDFTGAAQIDSSELARRLEKQRGLLASKPNPNVSIQRRVSVLLFGVERTAKVRELEALDSRFPEQFDVFRTTAIAEFQEKLRSLIPPTRVTASDQETGEELLADMGLDRWNVLELGDRAMIPTRVELKGFFGSLATASPVPMYPGRQVTLAIDSNRDRLVWKGWEKSGPWQLWDTGRTYFRFEPRRRVGDATGLVVSARALPEANDVFPERPQTVLARLEQYRGDRLLGSYNLWDFRFAGSLDVEGTGRDTGGPTELVLMPRVRWFDKPFEPQGNPLAELSARLTLWIKPDPITTEVVTVESGKTLTHSLENADFVIEHQGDRLIVRVTKGKGISRDGRAFDARDWIVDGGFVAEADRSYAVDGSRASHSMALHPTSKQRTLAVQLQSFSSVIAQPEFRELRFSEVTPER